MPKKNRTSLIKNIAFNVFLVILALFLLLTAGKPSTNLDAKHQGVKYEQE